MLTERDSSIVKALGEEVRDLFEELEAKNLQTVEKLEKRLKKLEKKLNELCKSLGG